VYLWCRKAGNRWVKAHEELLQAQCHGQLVIVGRPGRKFVQLEIACTLRKTSRSLLKDFGGRIEKLSRNWRERFTRGDAKPIKIGKRLVIVRSLDDVQSCSVRCLQRSSHRGARPDALRTAHPAAQTIKSSLLVIPGSIAFGTGEHATTAMSLRLLEELTRHWKAGWSIEDLGTGSGILALAASRFGAGRILGLDTDPAAIATAKSNAQLNKIRGATFQLADVRELKSARETQVITANLYSDLLIQILPELRCTEWLILSGILRTQQTEFVRALRRNKIKAIRLRRRGKWVAILARCGGRRAARELGTGKVLR